MRLLRPVLVFMSRHPIIFISLTCLSFTGMIASLSYNQCLSEWAASGMRVQWSLRTGCLLEAKPGKWIPARAYRELP